MTLPRRSRIAVVFGAVALIIVLVVASFLYKLDRAINPPDRGFMGQRLYPSPVDTECINRTLRQEFGEIDRFTFSAGSLPDGVFEDTFSYYRSPTSYAWVMLGVTELPEGTRIKHSFIGDGAKLEQSEFPPAIAAMDKANQAIRTACKIDLSMIELKEVGQRVDALH